MIFHANVRHLLTAAASLVLLAGIPARGAGSINRVGGWGSLTAPAYQAPTGRASGGTNGGGGAGKAGGGSEAGGPQSNGPNALTQSDVEGIIARVVHEANARRLKSVTIAVVDRMGAVLAVWQSADEYAWVRNNPTVRDPGLPDGLNGVQISPAAAAIAKAITGAYLSSSAGNAFSTRTASQIIQDHFNPGTRDASSGPLYGVQFSQLPCSDVMNRFNASSPFFQPGPNRSPLGLAADPGGLPLYKNGELVGGVGVKAVGPYGYDLNIHVDDNSVDETLALAGTIGLAPPARLTANTITVGGLTLRYTDVSTRNFVSNPAAAPPYSRLESGLIMVPGYHLGAAEGILPGSVYGTQASGLMPDLSGMISATRPPLVLSNCANGICIPRYPTIADPHGSLSQSEVTAILRSAYGVALQARAQIRNPPGSSAAVTVSVTGVTGTILGLVTVPDAPNFGIDVAVQKARTAFFLSSASAGTVLNANPFTAKFNNAATSFFQGPVFSQGIAWSARAIGNIARDTYPDGINNSPHGPFSLSAVLTTPFSVGLQLDAVVANIGAHVAYLLQEPGSSDTPQVCTGLQPQGADAPLVANGLQIFPGGFPIYRGNRLIGGIGVSGDGVDQDDMIAFLGLYNAGVSLGTGISNAPAAMRANMLAPLGIAPRYVNCPYAPFLDGSGNNICDGK